MTRSFGWKLDRWPLYALMLTSLLCSCVSTTDELLGLAERPPLDRAVLVTGGAFFTDDVVGDGTFRAASDLQGQESSPRHEEAISFASVVDVLERGAVFQRIVADDDSSRRRRLLGQLDAPSMDEGVIDFLRKARNDGFDLLLIVEDLQDGPIESQGVNGRWPVTFATWIMLGVGAFIPDHTFESRSALRVSLRELQTGTEVDSLLLVPGPIDLALTERTDLLGLAMSIIVPPFWVADDRLSVNRSVRETSQRRLLLSLVRELKSDVRRRRLGEREAATLSFERGRDGSRIVVESAEAVSVARLVSRGLDDDVAQDFVQRLLSSRSIQDGRMRYEATLPESLRGRFQVRVGTLRGGVASSTFRMDEAR